MKLGLNQHLCGDFWFEKYPEFALWGQSVDRDKSRKMSDA